MILFYSNILTLRSFLIAKVEYKINNCIKKHDNTLGIAVFLLYRSDGSLLIQDVPGYDQFLDLCSSFTNGT